MGKIIFLIPTGEEAELFYPVYKELVKRGHDVLNIETGTICCSKNTKMPDISLKEFDMNYKSIYDYKTYSASKIIQFEKPDIVIIGSDQDYLRRAFLYVAKQYNIPCILIDVAFGSNIMRGQWLTTRRSIYRLVNYPVSIMTKYLYVLRTVFDLKWNLFKILKMIYKDFYEAIVVEDARGTYGCDLIFVAGSWEKEVLIGRGVSEENIYITGNPRMSELMHERNIENENKIKRELGINEKDRIILFHTSAQVEHGRWTLDMRKEFINRVIDEISLFLDEHTKLVLRIHPVESLEEYQEIIKGRKEPIILCKSNSFVDVVGMSDLLIFGAYSVMVLESTALGKVCLLLNVFNEIKNLPYEEMGLAKCIYKYEDIKFTVNEMLNDIGKRDEFLKGVKRFYDNNKEFVDGRATERIVKLIEANVK